MDINLPLDELTTEEKLRLLEIIWADLCRTPGQVPSSAWHGGVLREREKRAQEGSATFVDWTEAKKKMRESTG